MSLFLIRVYRYWISPIWGNCCRYYPSCSEYAQSAIIQYGLLSGGWLMIKRLCRCHPFGGYGYDPVPPLNHTINHGACSHAKAQKINQNERVALRNGL